MREEREKEKREEREKEKREEREKEMREETVILRKRTSPSNTKQEFKNEKSIP